jgi:hypothetical protein
MPWLAYVLGLAMSYASWVLLALIAIDSGRLVAFAIRLARRQ